MSRPAGEGHSALLRWAAAGAAALGFHAAVAAVLIRAAEPATLATGGVDAIPVELDPVEGDSAKADEPTEPAEEATSASAPAADAAASQAAPTQPPPALPAQPEPAVQPANPPPPNPKPTPLPEPPAAEPPPPPEAAEPEVAKPPPPAAVPPDLRPEPPQPMSPPRPVTPPTPAVQASAAAAAALDASPIQRRSSAAREAAWRGKLVAHLNRYRRFPPGLHTGTARIGFTLDGEGRVTAAAVVAGSGDPALDAAARDLVERASPFPVPPLGITGVGLRFVVPVHYDAGRP